MRKLTSFERCTLYTELLSGFNFIYSSGLSFDASRSPALGARRVESSPFLVWTDSDFKLSDPAFFGRLSANMCATKLKIKAAFII
ncbi:hypothetical protein [Nocardia sp. N2S4-5]|uniref:hypothetical protein n=1 Tax=Nocardia sp. N2S4-5 TaxID=3351565 RepID=UPI0037D3009D